MSLLYGMEVLARKAIGRGGSGRPEVTPEELRGLRALFEAGDPFEKALLARHAQGLLNTAEKKSFVPLYTKDAQPLLKPGAAVILEAMVQEAGKLPQEIQQQAWRVGAVMDYAVLVMDGSPAATKELAEKIAAMPQAEQAVTRRALLEQLFSGVEPTYQGLLGRILDRADKEQVAERVFQVLYRPEEDPNPGQTLARRAELMMSFWSHGGRKVTASEAQQLVAQLNAIPKDKLDAAWGPLGAVLFKDDGTPRCSMEPEAYETLRTLIGGHEVPTAEQRQAELLTRLNYYQSRASRAGKTIDVEEATHLIDMIGNFPTAQERAQARVNMLSRLFDNDLAPRRGVKFDTAVTEKWLLVQLRAHD